LQALTPHAREWHAGTIREGSTRGAEELMGRSAAGATLGVAEAVAKGGISTDKELLINAIRGRKVRNIFRKIKENIHKILSPASGDKSVDKIALPSKNSLFLYL